MKERKEGDSMKPISPRQQVTLDFIKGFISEKGYAPSVREIGQGIFLTAHSTVCALLDRLEENGYIERIAGKSRSIRIVGQGVSLEEQIDDLKNQIAGILKVVEEGLSKNTEYHMRTALTAIKWALEEGESDETNLP
jgi:repressor LexA